MVDFSLHRDFWYFNKREDKRYCLIFSNWTNVLLSYSISFFNSEEEIKEETKMIMDMYCSTPRPYKKNVGSKWYKKYELVFEEGSFYWGYVIFDFETDTYRFFHDGAVIPLSKPRYNYKKYINDCIVINSKSNKLLIKDYFLRKPGEIDPDYKFKNGEYDGWLQFRWGDGKNVIGLSQPEDAPKEEIKRKNYKPKDKYFKKLDDEELKQFEESETENLQNEMDKEIEKEKLYNMEIKYGW